MQNSKIFLKIFHFLNVSFHILHTDGNLSIQNFIASVKLRIFYFCRGYNLVCKRSPKNPAEILNDNALSVYCII